LRSAFLRQISVHGNAAHWHSEQCSAAQLGANTLPRAHERAAVRGRHVAKRFTWGAEGARTREGEVENDRIRMAGRRRTPSCLSGIVNRCSRQTAHAAHEGACAWPPPASTLLSLPPLANVPHFVRAQRARRALRRASPDLPRSTARDTPVRGRSMVAAGRPRQASLAADFLTGHTYFRRCRGSGRI